MSEDIEWGPPPQRSGGNNGKWVDRLRPFLSRPGEWGRLPGEYEASTAARLRRGTYGYVLPPGAWDFRAKYIKGSNHRAHVWARYLGPAAKDAVA